LRFLWLSAVTADWANVEVQRCEYDENIYPNTSESSWEVSKCWAKLIRQHVPKIDIIFSSEPYGNYLAEILEIESDVFDPPRIQQPVSATAIREKPEKHWDFLPAIVRPWFINTVCLVGTESTGKSTLTKRLATRYCADDPPDYVSEAGRDLVPQTAECRFETLLNVAETHARKILEAATKYRKHLFIDTDVRITQSYAKYFFGKTLEVPDWIKAVNHFKIWIYLDKSAPYVQDGTRLNREDRDRLDEFHRAEFALHGIPLYFVSGKSWQDREDAVIQHIERFFTLLPFTPN
jgi:HTH-type transcriptional repressor of NAD biosynthesis genes